MQIRTEVPGLVLILASAFLSVVAMSTHAQQPSSRGARKTSQATEQSPASKQKIVRTGTSLAAELARQKGGLVKAMLHLGSNGKILRCFNSFLTGPAATTLPCGFTVGTRPDRQADRQTVIRFGFQVDDRFVLTTPVNAGGRFQAESAQPTTAPIEFDPGAGDTVIVTTSRPEQPFMIFVF